jgi:hypothetical protein
MEAQAIVEIERRRSALRLIGATFALYRRFPWLFLVLAAVVVVPYEVLETLPRLGLLHGAARGWVEFALGIGEVALVLPLVSALHVYAVDDVRQGRRPRIESVARRGLARLRVISPAVLLTWIGIVLGLVALVVPGILLYARWAVVAQTGSLDAMSGREALAQSAELAHGNYRHNLGLLLLVFLITSVPYALLTFAFGTTNALGPFLIRSALAVVTSSFAALATAFLYFDLKARLRSAPAPGGPSTAAAEPRSISGRIVAPDGNPHDPASWSDEDRPRGWYVDPDAPWVMRYWTADPGQTWSRRSAKTPKAIAAEWRDLRWVREKKPEDRAGMP